MKRLVASSLLIASVPGCFFILGLQKGLTCGDGILTEAKGEECDDGNNLPADGLESFNDSCSAACTIPKCGDGILDTFATVDTNNDGLINFNDSFEQCDDGNNTDGDGCEANCQTPRCGDGIVESVQIDTDFDGIPDTTELCDDGTTCADGAACDPLAFQPCADGSQCFIRGGDGCSQDCTKIEICGDNFVDLGEECDDGNTTDADGCEGNCKNPACGDNIVDPNEFCLDILAAPTVVFSGSVKDLKVGDLDGDANQDLVISSNALITVLFGDGDGTFAAPVNITTESSTVNNIAIGDFDNNGTLDILIQDRIAPNGLDIIQINADKSFVALADATTAVLQGPFLTGDFNNDGNLDVFSAVGGQIEIGSGDRLFTDVVASFVPALPSSATNPVIGDIDGDQDADLVFESNNNGIVVAINNGGNNFSTSVIFEAESFRDHEIGDVDGDGDLDIFYIVASGNTINVLLNNGAGSFAPKITGVDQGSDEVFAVDFSGDGSDEMFLLDVNEATVFSIANGAPLTTAQLDGTPFSPRLVNFADLNNDGLKEFIFSDLNNNVSFLIGNP